MLNLLAKTKLKEANFTHCELDVLLSKIAQVYRIEEVNDDRKKYLSKTIKKYGYLPYPQFKVLQELTPAETIFTLIEKLKYAKTFSDDKFISFKFSGKGLILKLSIFVFDIVGFIKFSFIILFIKSYKDILPV